ncbi:MAG: radical SAM protein [Magnetococcales bacterium]|nr:radical SAM protein [Magnetococcales bacterium]
MHGSLLESAATNIPQVTMEIAREILRDHPEDLLARYQLGIACCRADDRVAGVRELARLFADHYHPVMTGSDQEAILLLGLCALQFAQLSELLIVRNEREWGLHVDLGVRIALEAATRTGQERLARLAGLLGERIVRHGPDEAIWVRPDSPRQLQVEPTNHCNLHCVMCPRNGMARPAGFLTIPVWETILAGWGHRHRQLTVSNILHPANLAFEVRQPGLIKLFFMGEPLLHHSLGELVRIAHVHGCRVAVQTNGVLLKNPKIRRTLLDAGLDQLFISVDGPDAVAYAGIRRGGEWDGLLAGVRAMDLERRAAGLKETFLMCVTTIVPRQIPDFEARVLEFLQPLFPHVDHFFPIALGVRDQTRFLDAAGRIVPWTKEPAAQARCEEPLYKMNLLWDGTATPCCYDIDGQLALGSVADSGVDAIWQGAAMASIQRAALRNTHTHPLCRQCLA